MKLNRWAGPAAAVLVAAPVFGQVKESLRLRSCGEVFREVMGVKEGIPVDLLHKAYCVAVIPSVKKAALGLGGRFGKGAVVCRTDRGGGPWGAPLMISIGGGSIGLQIGAEATDYVFVVTNPKGIDKLLESKFTLGADCSIAAGPVGRNLEAATDIQMRAEILTYSRSRGVFAGLALEGAVVKQDEEANEAVYGRHIEPRDLLLARDHTVPAAAHDLLEALREISPRRVSD
jgi:lipid-binding SYLF domain-containing protein